MTDASQPNILFIMADQLRWRLSRLLPAIRIWRRPNIDALAARGARFTRAYVQSPVCGASRMSYLYRPLRHLATAPPGTACPCGSAR